MEVALGSLSPLNLRGLNITTADRAATFWKGCGFDLGLSHHQKELEQLMAEAIFFIRNQLMTEKEKSVYFVPSELLGLVDLRRLLLLASVRNPRRRYVRLWACCVLKIMQGLSRIENSGRLAELEQAREQIFSRIKSLVHESSGGSTFLGRGQIKVPLVGMDWKEFKTRNSILLKLLHKTEFATEELFDYLGVRFVVPSDLQVPLLLRTLIEADIIVPHQVLGFRTRNSLIDTKRPKALLDLSQDLFKTGTVTLEEYLAMCERVPWGTGSGRRDDWKNSFSSSDYRALQITVRHMIRLPNPVRKAVDSMVSELRHLRGMDRDTYPYLSAAVPAEIVRYFPIEIQIFDESSYDLSRFGPASHERYKKLQLKAVRDRILGNLLKMTPEKMATQECT